MKASAVIIINLILLGLNSLYALELKDKDRYFDHIEIAPKEYKYTYIEKEHTRSEVIRDVAVIYGLASVLYPITQPEILDGTTGSWSNYRKNFGRLVFDQDEPFWNFFVHPLTGSQQFLYYRARGYTKMESFHLTFLSSALFEFTIETFSEPASVQDIFNTPMLGSILGVGIESLSFYLINSRSTIGKILGHIINPSTLLWFYDGKMRITPYVNGKGTAALSFNMEI